jgi:hypothetical protein
MKKLLVILTLCLFGGCAASYEKAINDAFNSCKEICAAASTKQLNVVCFEKDKKEPICMCVKQ